MRAARLGLLDGDRRRTESGSWPSTTSRRVDRAARAEPPAVLVVDSVQTATVADLDGAAGSVGQVRESTVRLMAYAKGEGIAVILAGHVTKDGSIAGPKTLEHLVDAVLNLEGERYVDAATAARVEEPVRVDRGGRRVRDARDAVWPR